MMCIISPVVQACNEEVLQSTRMKLDRREAPCRVPWKFGLIIVQKTSLFPLLPIHLFLQTEGHYSARSPSLEGS